MNKNNLNRIKGILSAKQGTQVPKFQSGFVIYHKSTNQPLYSKDGTSWFTDEDYMSPFTGSLNDFTEPELGQQFYTKNPNVTISNQPVNNNSPKDFSLPNTSKTYDFIQNPLVGSGVENYYNYLKDNNQLESNNKPPFLDIISQYNLNFEIPGGINTDPNASVKTAAASNQQVQNKIQQTINDVVAEETLTNRQIRQERREERQQFRQDRRDERQTMYQEKLDTLNAQATPEREKNWNTALNVMDGISQIGDAVGAAQMATDSDTTKTATAMYDGLSNVISKAGPYGKIISGAMQAGKAIGDIAQWAGGGTDQQTKIDQWIDSPFFSWNVGLINGFAGKNTDSFSIDQDVLSQVGSSYGGSVTNMSEAAETADKKYGLFSSKDRKKANEAIAKAKSNQNLMGDIADTTADQRLLVSSMGEQAGLAYSMMTDGGYNQKYTYAAKEGGILEWNPQIELKWEPLIELNWELPKFKEGGNIDIVEELEWIPELQKGNKIYTPEESIDTEKYPQEYLEFKASLPDNQKNTPENEYRTYLYWQLWGKPKDFEYTLNNPNEDGQYMYTWDESDKSYHGSSIAWGNDGIGYFIKPKHHDTIQYELDYYNDGTITKEGGKQRKPNKKERESWEEFRRNYILEDDGDFYKYVPVKQILQDLEISQQKYLKEGGSLGDKDIPEIEETSQKNVIPEGALHKNKHHMEHAEGLTKKGIPVIDEEGEQQAEIEHSEIIFTLEVTKKLEEYYQIFYSEESTNKEKEQAALDTGKLLVYQILENTEDRTGLIESCKKGGSLTLKKSTDDLIEEVLEWMPTITIIEEVIEEPKETSKKESKKSEKEQMKEAIKEVLIELLTK